MKKQVLVCALAALFFACEDNSPMEGSQEGNNYIEVEKEDIPANIREYVTQEYPDFSIVKADQYDDGYEIYLSNGLELNFALNGQFLSVGEGYVPVAIVDLPRSVSNYIAQNYDGISITRAQRDDDGFEVFLEDGLELNFNRNGRFLYADDRGMAPGEGYVPVAVEDLPESITNYIAQNFEGVGIARAQRDDDGFEVYLANGIELNFNLNGRFLYRG